LVAYHPDPKALPGETERFGERRLPESDPLPPVDDGQIDIALGKPDAIGISGAGIGHGAPGTTTLIPTGPTPGQSSERTHKIAKGDNPESIAKKYYGRRALGTKLAEYNGIKPTDLKIGQEIKVPDIAVLDPSAAPQAPAVGTPSETMLVGTPNANPIDMTASQPTPETPRYGKRKLREGDTLFGIAKEVYGDGSRWKEIATLNGLSQKSTLRPGVEIKYALAN
ncbi:MAG: hypothetical protein RIR10_1148, partial [Planctomycetota bacterium]